MVCGRFVTGADPMRRDSLITYNTYVYGQMYIGHDYTWLHANATTSASYVCQFGPNEACFNLLYLLIYSLFTTFHAQWNMELTADIPMLHTSGFTVCPKLTLVMSSGWGMHQYDRNPQWLYICGHGCMDVHACMCMDGRAFMCMDGRAFMCDVQRVCMHAVFVWLTAM